MTTVLVTGATGTVGRHVPGELLPRGARVRAFVRDPGRAAGVLGDVVTGDFADPASVRRALDGVDRVFLCAANHPRQAEHERTVIDAAAEAGVRLIVKVGNQGARPGAPVAFWDANGGIEEHLERSGVPWVILHPSSYATNLLAGAAAVRDSGRLFVPAGDARVSFIDPRDVAAVAAVVLTEPGHDRRTYTLTGPEAVTLDEFAKHLSAALGRTVEYVDVPGEAARAAMLESGLPPWAADQIVAIWGEIRRGVLSTPTDVVRVLTGREARTVADFCQDHAGAFR